MSHERVELFVLHTQKEYDDLLNEIMSLCIEKEKLREACESVVEQLSPSVVNIVIFPNKEPFSVKLCREALDMAPERATSIVESARELIRLHDLGKGITTPEQRDKAWQNLSEALKP
jgi:hypothetical protein